MRRFSPFMLKALLTVALVAGTHATASAQTASADEQTWRYGDHVYTMRGTVDYGTADPTMPLYEPTAWVTFTNVPSDYTEFAKLYREFLGRSPHGTAAMIAMAMEMLARNEAEGTRCMTLLCGKSAAMGNIRILKTKLPKPGQMRSADSYIQRYLPAAILQGANAKNGYTPHAPYTVQMCPGNNAPQGDYTFLYILGGGWDLVQRPATVKLLDDGHYQLVSCSSVYTQCQNMKGDWKGLK